MPVQGGLVNTHGGQERLLRQVLPKCTFSVGIVAMAQAGAGWAIRAVQSPPRACGRAAGISCSGKRPHQKLIIKSIGVQYPAVSRSRERQEIAMPHQDETSLARVSYDERTRTVTVTFGGN